MMHENRSRTRGYTLILYTLILNDQDRVYPTRRGVTFLESILSVIILSMVVISLSSAVSFLSSSQRRMEQRLGGAELANRLVLQYMDDPESLPNRSLPIEYDKDFYRWSLDEENVKFEYQDQVDGDTGAAAGNGVSLNRIKLITIKVWLSADSGGSRAFSFDVPNITLTRLIDPLAFANPDSFQTLLEQPGGLERIVESMLDIEEGS